MSMVRSIFVAILAVGLVVTLARISLGHGEEHHASHHEEHHSSHHEEHHGSHGEHHNAYHPEHHEAHHDEHHGQYHNVHYTGHGGEHHDAHYPERHGEHHDAHYPEHRGEHHEAHYPEHPGEHHDAHYGEHHGDYHDVHYPDRRDDRRDGHRDEHRDDRHGYDDHHRFDHRDWHRHAWWHHQPTWHNRSWQHWWHCPTAPEMAGWSAGWGMAAPIYYNYGPGGNVVYRDNQVYVNGAAIGTSDAYTASAVTLANAGPVGSAADDQPGDWLPLGTFAVLRNEEDTRPSLTLQLAVDKSGSISGVLFDLLSDTSTPVRGSVDRATQRVAFDLGAKSGLVAETGFYNLTRDKVTVLIHKGSAKPQTYTMVRFNSLPSGANEEDVALSAK